MPSPLLGAGGTGAVGKGKSASEPRSQMQGGQEPAGERPRRGGPVGGPALEEAMWSGQGELPTAAGQQEGHLRPLHTYPGPLLSRQLSLGSHREPRALPEDVCQTPFTTERTEAWRSGVRREAPML